MSTMSEPLSVLELQNEVDRLAPWHYCHVLPGGVTTGDCTTETTHPKLVHLLDSGAFRRRMYPEVLDLGANSGIISMWFADNKGSRVIAVEGNEKYYEQLCFVTDVKGYQSKVFPLCSNVCDEFAIHRYFDLVLCLGLLHHLAPDCHLPLLRRCRSALQPGGEIVVQTKDDLPVEALLKEAGFLMVEKLRTSWADRAAWQAIKDPMKI